MAPTLASYWHATLLRAAAPAGCRDCGPSPHEQLSASPRPACGDTSSEFVTGHLQRRSRLSGWRNGRVRKPQARQIGASICHQGRECCAGIEVHLQILTAADGFGPHP